MALTCHSVGVTFPTAEGTSGVAALTDVELTVRDREFVSIVGPSGCGKTTLLRVISGLIAPTAGHVSFAGDADGHHSTAMVFQEHALLPWLDLTDNIALPLEARGVARGARRKRAAAIATRLGLGEFLAAYPNQLSGGMRQRGGIARALLSEPAVLLMDEPFGSLDAQTRMVLQEELLANWEQDRRSVVFVTHDIREAIQLSDRVIILSGRPGRVIEDIEIPLPRPRAALRTVDPQVEALHRRVWDLLEAEARSNAAR
jgi:NitT/TauT family transport system ATP-binding protein